MLKRMLVVSAVAVLCATALHAQYSLYFVNNPDFGASLDRWFNCALCTSQPGTVEWSSEHGGSAHLVASGAPGCAGIAQAIGTFLLPGDTIVMRVTHSDLGNFGDVNVMLATSTPFSQAARTDGPAGYYEVRLVCQQFWSVGTMLTIGLSVWPGSGEAWIHDVELRRGGSLALLEDRVPPQIDNSSHTTRAYPVPTASSAAVEFNLPAPTRADVRIYTPAGILVRSLAIAARAGLNSARWDGLDDGQRRVPAGAYFYKIDDGVRTIGEGKLLIAR